jgi:CBS domain-containing protein
MRIGEIMTRDVEVAAPGDTLQSAARLMADLDVGALPVADGDQLVGMITDRDITVRGVATGQAPERCTVGEIMSTELRYCLEDDTVEEVAERMGALQVRRLPVLDRDERRLVGIVALGDLATLGGREETTAEALREISEPAGEPAPEIAAGVQPSAAGACGEDRDGRGRERTANDLAADEAARGGGGVGP